MTIATDLIEGSITGAEFKVRLGGLGVSPSWFAEYHGVAMRTVVRWLDGDIVMGGVVQSLDQLEEMTLDQIREELAAIPKKGPVTLTTWRTDKEFLLLREDGMPSTWHRALTYRVREHLVAEGRDVTIVYG